MALNDAATAFPDKRNNVVALVSGGQFFFNVFQCLRYVETFVVNDAVQIEDVVDLFDGKSAPLQAYTVDAAITQRVANGFDVGRNVFVHKAAAGDKGVLTNAGKLLHRAYTRQ